MKGPVFLMVAMSLVLAAVAPGAAQSKSVKPVAVGDPFPRLEGEFLTGRKAILPDAAAGKFALVLMGFTYQSRFSVESWAEHVRPAFAQRGNATFFEVPVLGGMARLGKWFIDSGMRSGTPKDLHENVITVWGGVDRWKAIMGFSDAAQDDAYLALIDAKGRVVWLYHGSYTDAAFAAMMEIRPRESFPGTTETPVPVSAKGKLAFSFCPETTPEVISPCRARRSRPSAPPRPSRSARRGL